MTENSPLPSQPRPCAAPPQPRHSERLTWAAMLGQWGDFARSALALPDDAQGRRMRGVVPSIIALQAVGFALQNLDDLDAEERAFGLDRAGVMIAHHVDLLNTAWPATQDDPMPSLLIELIEETRQQWRTARAAVRNDGEA